MNIDWSMAGVPEAAGVPDLRRTQFEWLLGTQTPQGRYMEDVIEAVVAAARAGDPEVYRMLKSKLAAQRFVFADVMALLVLFGPQIAALFPDEEITEAAVLALWQEALGQ